MSDLVLPVLSKLPGRQPKPLLLFTVSLLLASLCGICCYLIAGNSLNLFIGGVFFAALLAPPLTAIAGRAPVLLGITLGIGFCWWKPVHAEIITAGQWGMCVMVLATFVAVLVMATLALKPLSPVAASAIVTVTALAWLSWPIWLSGSLTGAQLNASVLFHPLFAINHVVSDLGIWTEQQGAYGLTNLGQDVPYRLPTSAWPVIALQSAIALALTIWMNWSQHPKNKSPASHRGR